MLLHVVIARQDDDLGAEVVLVTDDPSKTVEAEKLVEAKAEEGFWWESFSLTLNEISEHFLDHTMKEV
jgi:hypothetical protein